MQITITIHGVTLEIDFEYTPPEHNNWGHPDDRMPDVDEEVILNSACVEDVDILSLLSEDVQADIETVILRECKNELVGFIRLSLRSLWW